MSTILNVLIVFTYFLKKVIVKEEGLSKDKEKEKENLFITFLNIIPSKASYSFFDVKARECIF